MARDVVETRRDRRVLAADAGMGRASLLSVLAGVMTALGTFLLVLGVTAGVLRLVGIDTQYYSASRWKQVGLGAGLIGAGVLLVSFLFGGYVAGRMSRRAGFTNGLLVFVAGVVIAVGGAVLVDAATSNAELTRNLRSVGIPTRRSDWYGTGLVCGIAALAAMLVGSLLGGTLGERWHGKLLARAIDPMYGPEPVAPAPRHAATVEGEAATEHVRRIEPTEREEPRPRADAWHNPV